MPTKFSVTQQAGRIYLTFQDNSVCEDAYSMTRQLSAPSTLEGYHSGCNRMDKSRHPDCLAAVSRYCQAIKQAGGGVSQEIGYNVFGVSCFQSQSYHDASLQELKQFNEGCDSIEKAISNDCAAAIHRFCVDRHPDDEKSIGIVQEIGSSSFGLACIKPNWYGDVDIQVLSSQFVGSCNDVSRAQSTDCVSAIHRWCTSNNHGDSGISQEVGNGRLGVGCFNPIWYGDVSVPKEYGKSHPIVSFAPIFQFNSMAECSGKDEQLQPGDDYADRVYGLNVGQSYRYCVSAVGKQYMVNTMVLDGSIRTSSSSVCMEQTVYWVRFSSFKVQKQKKQ